LPEIKLIVTKFLVERAYYNGKFIYEAINRELPKNGILGSRLQSFIIELKHNLAGSYEKTSKFIEDFTGECFSQQTIKDSILRVGKQLEPSYRELESDLRNSETVGCDETGWRVNGLICYLWLLCTANIVLIKIDKSRSRKVLTNIFGVYFDGIIVSDCYNAYQKFAKNFQKCWSHLLRTTHNLAKENSKEDIVKLHKLLKNLFNEGSNFLKDDPSIEKREIKYNELNKKFKDIINYNWKSKFAISIVKNRLKKFKNHWFTAILIPRVDLTNNFTERNIRKVSGFFFLGIFFSVFAYIAFNLVIVHFNSAVVNGGIRYIYIGKRSNGVIIRQLFIK
jgi:hypothetical protein